jgi:DNA-directed RNA polymerase specialized sigma subunit
MTVEQLKKIAWLERAFYAEKLAKAYLEKCERERSFAERLSRTFSESGSNSGNSTEDALIRLAVTERKTQEKLQELVRVREEISEAIQQIEEPDLQAVLVWHYLNYFTFEQTAEKMHYGTATVYRKHKQALNQIDIENDSL